MWPTGGLPGPGLALILLCHLLQCLAGKCQSGELGNYNEKTTETELSEHPDLTVGLSLECVGTDITPGSGRESTALSCRVRGTWVPMLPL